jgi:4-amino-4-deoxy-L-arabinose transferase-like glycosyltransferase
MIRKFISLVCFGFALAFAYLYYVTHFKHRACFNELGRCFDAETGAVYSEQSGIVWLLLATLALGVGLYTAWHLRKSKR